MPTASSCVHHQEDSPGLC
ncbi:hypothetical protein LUU34_00471100 [Aix galericulata]|nr:hypothetical protein LUU34_00471100 [Aix galericulata]